jgi:sialidase-1
VCQASLIRYSWPDDGGSVLLFSNPAHESKRIAMTVRLSRDESKTWPASLVVEPGSAAYSCLARLPDGRVGILYERENYGDITFAAFEVSRVE